MDLVGDGNMPLITGVDRDHREVSVVALGPVSLKDVREHLLHKKREGGLGYPELADVRGAGIVSDSGELQQIADFLRELSRESPLGCIAFVVSSEADVAATRELEALVGDCCDMRTFRSAEDARAWLGTGGHPRSDSVHR
jgi:hypothetical protein